MTALSIETPVGVVGAGTMGAGIAQIAATAGHSVCLYDLELDAAQAGIERIEQSLNRFIKKRKISDFDKQSILERISVSAEISDLAGSGLVIEAIVENLTVKQKLFKQLESVCQTTTLLATNTSSISVTSIAAGLKRPENFVGMHFFNPAPIMKLVEVIRGMLSANEAVQTIYDTVEQWGKKPAYATSTPAFIVNRVARPYYAEALRILQEGGSDICTIDTVMRESGGFRMGPFELMDLIGLDVNYAVTRSVFDAYYQDRRFQPSVIQQEMVNAGLLGRKSGRGFYDYRELATPVHAHTAEVGPPPNKVEVYGSLGIAEDLIGMIQSAGIEIEHHSNSHAGWLKIGDVQVAITDGTTATEHCAAHDQVELIFFDLALNYKQCKRIALTKADQSSEAALLSASGLFHLLGKNVSVIDDIPGMIVMRTVCMLANEGADAVNQQVCSAEAVDIAMQNGVNYPKGPLAWAEQMGIDAVVEVLRNLKYSYGEERYRVSPWLRRKSFSRAAFYE